MNILPKKRWHVRTKENIARVRRDEAEALEKEKEAQRRILLAEQEARTNFLRAKARTSEESSSERTTATATNEPIHQHINFFEDIEKSGGYKGGTNKEHEEEKKQEQEKYEKSIGLLNYLGQGSTEATGDTPWYLKSHDSRLEDEDKKSSEKEKNKSGGKDFLDPMNDMKKYLKMTFGSEDPKKKTSSHETDKSRESKDNKRKRRESSDDNSNTNKKSSLAKLREERLKREKEERQRQSQLLARLSGKVDASQPKSIAVDERCNRYNSQFNPHLARQNQPKD